MTTIFVPATIVFLLGVYDDLRGVGPYVKFTVQGIAAAMLYAGGLRIVNIPVCSEIESCPGMSDSRSLSSGYSPSRTLSI